ncbi:MAG: hypothetical protein K1X86_11940 [Ignavibacteria bacterium]|nr:hypothetical protein [Ignavibacteria bacterium]
MAKVIKLKYKKTIELIFHRPFSFRKTFHAPSRFKSGLEHFDGVNYFLSLRFSNECFGLKFYMQSTRLFLDIYSKSKLTDSELKKISEEIFFRFPLAKDMSSFYQVFSKDEFIKNVIKRNKGKHIISIYSLYENLIISTLLQNATIQRTISMCENMLDNYGYVIEFKGCSLKCMWDVEEFNPSEEDLRRLKLGYRAKNILRINTQFKDHRINEKELRLLEISKLTNELLKIYGVGKQTVFYLILGQFHIVSYLEHIPLWERKILSYYLFKKELVDEKELVNWFNKRYSLWCGYSLSLIMEDIFHQHKAKPLDWMKKIMREE